MPIITFNPKSKIENPKLHHVVIVGGGFGGLHAARALKRANVRVTLIDRRNFHLFQPLLYQVATGALSPANIASPLRAILRRQRNVEVLLAEVVDFDLAGKRAILSDGAVDYDTLIVAAGAKTGYFGHDDWERNAPGLKSIEDATAIRRHVLMAFEAAERDVSPKKRQELLTFVIVGGGPTGVELAGALAEITRYTLKNDFRQIRPSSARILLIEGGERILAAFPDKLGKKAVDYLAGLGVTVRTKATVKEIGLHSVTIQCGDQLETIATEVVLWAAGVQASPLGRTLASAAGLATDRTGRIGVQPDLTIPGHPDVFVIGDLALSLHHDGKPLPGVAPVAIQEGQYAATTIRQRLTEKPTSPFRYRNYGSMAAIGRSVAVVDFGWIRLSGFIAWLMWLFVHLMQIVQFENRLLVFIQWGWNYVTFSRSARLITEEGKKEE